MRDCAIVWVLNEELRPAKDDDDDEASEQTNGCYLCWGPFNFSTINIIIIISITVKTRE